MAFGALTAPPPQPNSPSGESEKPPSFGGDKNSEPLFQEKLKGGRRWKEARKGKGGRTERDVNRVGGSDGPLGRREEMEGKH